MQQDPATLDPISRSRETVAALRKAFGDYRVIWFSATRTQFPRDRAALCGGPATIRPFGQISAIWSHFTPRKETNIRHFQSLNTGLLANTKFGVENLTLIKP